MRFDDVKHQYPAQDRLQRALSGGRLPHAYLFAGPPGIGKEMLALRLAARLLCQSPITPPTPPDFADPQRPWSESCGTCDDCVMLAAGTHPDYHRVHRMLAKVHPDPDVRKRKAMDLGIDVIREFTIKPMGNRPSQGRAKVFVIVEAERLNDASQNAMLKSLEEPPASSYLILLAASADALFPTIRSRCHLVPFRTLPPEFVVQKLTDEGGMDLPAAEYLASLANGSLGLAYRYAQIGVFEKSSDVSAAVAGMVDDPLGSGKRLLDLAKELFEKVDDADDEAEMEVDSNATRESQNIVLAMTATHLRALQRSALGLGPIPGHTTGAGRNMPALSIGKAIKAVADAEYQLSRNAHAGLTFDVLGVTIGRYLSGNLEPIAS